VTRTCQRCNSTDISDETRWDSQHDESYVVCTCNQCGYRWEHEEPSAIGKTLAAVAMAASATAFAVVAAPVLAPAGAVAGLIWLFKSKKAES
jgi:hypothetical protein